MMMYWLVLLLLLITFWQMIHCSLQKRSTKPCCGRETARCYCKMRCVSKSAAASRGAPCDSTVFLFFHGTPYTYMPVRKVSSKFLLANRHRLGIGGVVHYACAKSTTHMHILQSLSIDRGICTTRRLETRKMYLNGLQDELKLFMLSARIPTTM